MKRKNVGKKKRIALLYVVTAQTKQITENTPKRELPVMYAVIQYPERTVYPKDRHYILIDNYKCHRYKMKVTKIDTILKKRVPQFREVSSNELAILTKNSKDLFKHIFNL